MLTLRSRWGASAPDQGPDGLSLAAEVPWLVRGAPDEIVAVKAALSPRVCTELAEDLLELRFVNLVGDYDAGPLGRLRVRSGKWSEGDYDVLLMRITEAACALPFVAGAPAALPADQSALSAREVLYHAFAWLRTALAPGAPAEHALLPALQAILREPHRRLTRTTREVPIELAGRIDPRELMEIAQGRWPLERAVTSGPLATALGGMLPQRVAESVVMDTRDVAENRFVKSFLDLCEAVIGQMRRELGGSAPWQLRLRTDCDTMSRALAPVLRHPLWREIGPMVHFPSSSLVLQRRHPYRVVLHHDLRIHAGARLPLNAHQARHLLEVKDVAALYELWSYFALIRAVSASRGPPVRVQRMRADAFQLGVPWEHQAEWADGVRVRYNPSFARSRRWERRSSSVPLRPDLILVIPEGPDQGLHLFDAKFKIERGDGEVRAKRSDLVKMHAYRDALPAVRSAWVLYPGTQLRFFPVGGGPVVKTPEGLAAPSDRGSVVPTEGVGVCPLGTEVTPAALEGVVMALCAGLQTGLRGAEGSVALHGRRVSQEEV